MLALLSRCFNASGVMLVACACFVAGGLCLAGSSAQLEVHSRFFIGNSPLDGMRHQ
jgi:DTW domain-containing protein YfiP